jgi:glycosyltransferase involved in cell wall biosynthesis
MSQRTAGTDTVTVIIPCYNAAPFLRETLESVMNQTQLPLEVLVIDDGSTDDSAAIAESFDPPVRVIRQPNRGESVARNRGIDEARGVWLAFLDADDLWHPTKTETLLAAATDDAVAVHCNVKMFGNSRWISRIEKIPEAERYSVQLLLKQNTLINPCSTLLVRREHSPRFPEWTRFSEDTIYCLELAARGRIQLVTEPLVSIRKHGGSQSARRTICVDWHATHESWLQRQGEKVARGIHEAIRSIWLQRIADQARKAKWSRDWDSYWILRTHLEKYRDHPEAAAVLQQTILPRWIYTVYDRIHPSLGQHANNKLAALRQTPEEV